MPWSNLGLAPELRPPWLGDGPVRVPASQPMIVVRDEGRGVHWNCDPEEAVRVLREESWAEPMSSPTLHLPFSYQRVPARIRLLAAKLIHLRQRLARTRQDPPWPIAASADVLLALYGERPPRLWGPARWGVVLSVDVDTIQGWWHAPRLAEIVERAGYRACYFVVGDVLQQAPEIAAELSGRGHEIGSHDLHHDNRLCSLAPAERDQRLQRARAVIEPFCGGGFRSPSLLRSAPLIEAVGRYFDYDSSVCDSDLEHARGCTTVFPYRLRGCLEIPITLPPDASLAYTGHSAAAGLELWQAKCTWVRGIGGVAQLLVHAEPHLACGRRLAAFAAFLAWLQQQQDAEICLLRDVVQRFRRDETATAPLSESAA